MLASVAEQASLRLTWSETPEDPFSRDEAQLFLYDYTWCYEYYEIRHLSSIQTKYG